MDEQTQERMTKLAADIAAHKSASIDEATQAMERTTRQLVTARQDFLGLMSSAALAVAKIGHRRSQGRSSTVQKTPP